MTKAWQVFRREYVERVRKKSFLILTLLGPLLILGLAVIPNLLLLSTPDTVRPLAVIDLSGQVADQVEPMLNPAGSALPDGRLRYPVRVVDPAGRPLEGVQEELNREVAAGTLHGYLVIDADLFAERPVSFYARNAANISESDRIRDALGNVIIPARFRDAGMAMDLEGIRRLTRRVRVHPVQIGADGRVESAGQGAQLGKLAAAYGMVIVFYMTFLMWGISIMRGVVEEKTSKIVEVLLSSVSSRQLMTGKVLGIGAVALTQYLVWAAAGIAGYYLSAATLGEWVSTLSLWTVVSFLGFFVLGYLFYASYFAALGACCSSDQEAQQMQQVGILPILAGFLVAFYVFTNPETPVSVVLSMLPPLTPFVMLVRINVLTPPFWQIALSVAAMVAGIGLMTVLAAKVFRVGILMTGKKPTVFEIWRWIRYA